MSFDLTSKRVIVTGGGSGIGRAATLELAGHGAQVCAVDIAYGSAQETASRHRSAAGSVVAACCDVRDPTAVMEVFSTAERDLDGTVNVLVNCAGIVVECDLLETKYEDWQRTIDVNVTGMFNCSAELVRRAVAATHPAVIVNIASINSFYAVRGVPAYCASKGAVLALTHAMAREHIADRIRVNCVCPGMVETPMLTADFERTDDPREARRQAEDAHAIGRVGRPEEIAHVIAFLVCDTGAMTGAALVADGGMTIGDVG